MTSTSASPLDDRILVQVRLALAELKGCRMTLAAKAEEARDEGLTGAEIDAACAGTSFDAKAAFAVKLARASRSGDPAALDAAIAKARAAGFSQACIDAILAEPDPCA